MAAGTEIFRLFGRIMIETSDAERSVSLREESTSREKTASMSLVLSVLEI